MSYLNPPHVEPRALWVDGPEGWVRDGVTVRGQRHLEEYTIQESMRPPAHSNSLERGLSFLLAAAIERTLSRTYLIVRATFTQSEKAIVHSLVNSQNELANE